ncbi:hypothetical protein RFI_17098, partial [Reticulomyxa filosa]
NDDDDKAMADVKEDGTTNKKNKANHHQASQTYILMEQLKDKAIGNEQAIRYFKRILQSVNPLCFDLYAFHMSIVRAELIVRTITLVLESVQPQLQPQPQPQLTSTSTQAMQTDSDEKTIPQEWCAIMFDLCVYVQSNIDADNIQFSNTLGATFAKILQHVNGTIQPYLQKYVGIIRSAECRKVIETKFVSDIIDDVVLYGPVIGLGMTVRFYDLVDRLLEPYLKNSSNWPITVGMVAMEVRMVLDYAVSKITSPLMQESFCTLLQHLLKVRAVPPFLICDKIVTRANIFTTWFSDSEINGVLECIALCIQLDKSMSEYTFEKIDELLRFHLHSKSAFSLLETIPPEHPYHRRWFYHIGHRNPDLRPVYPPILLTVFMRTFNFQCSCRRANDVAFISWLYYVFKHGWIHTLLQCLATHPNTTLHVLTRLEQVLYELILEHGRIRLIQWWYLLNKLRTTIEYNNRNNDSIFVPNWVITFFQECIHTFFYDCNHPSADILVSALMRFGHLGVFSFDNLTWWNSVVKNKGVQLEAYVCPIVSKIFSKEDKLPSATTQLWPINNSCLLPYSNKYFDPKTKMLTSFDI